MGDFIFVVILIYLPVLLFFTAVPLTLGIFGFTQFRAKNWGWAVFLCMGATAPFWLFIPYVVGQICAPHELAVRRTQVAAFKRNPLGPDHPRVLEDWGVVEYGAVALIDAGYFDRAVIYNARDQDGRPSGGFSLGPVRTTECVTWAKNEIQHTIGQDRVTHVSGSILEKKNSLPEPGPLTCVNATPIKMKPSDPLNDAVVVLGGFDTTLKYVSRSDRYDLDWPGKEIEIRQRKSGVSTLVDYQEVSYVYTPPFPSFSSFLPPGFRGNFTGSAGNFARLDGNVVLTSALLKTGKR